MSAAVTTDRAEQASYRDVFGLREELYDVARRIGTVGYYAQLRSEQAADRAQVAIVVCDAEEGITSEDLRVGEMAMQKKCATVIALNKWDVTRTDLEDAKARLTHGYDPAIKQPWRECML